MSQSASVWVVLVVALLAANLPFVNERLLGAGAAGGAARSRWRCGWPNWWCSTSSSGGIGLLFERRVGQIAPQGWEFYAVTGALFIVLAFPGLHLALPAQASDT